MGWKLHQTVMNTFRCQVEMAKNSAVLLLDSHEHSWSAIWHTSELTTSVAYSHNERILLVYGSSSLLTSAQVWGYKRALSDRTFLYLLLLQLSHFILCFLQHERKSVKQNAVCRSWNFCCRSVILFIVVFIFSGDMQSLLKMKTTIEYRLTCWIFLSGKANIMV